MSDPVVIVGMACRYPDASSPRELWENALAQRRAFRSIPSQRLNLEDYYAADPGAPDRTYAKEAALIEGFEFDRVRYRVSGASYRSADPVHWLALDVAARALSDAGSEHGEGLDRARTGILLGNTLTGEFARAEQMRLRWPFVRRTVAEALRLEGWDAAKRSGFLDELEERYKEPFAPVGADSLSGGLSNTIAGRIANHFDFLGGGYTVDGACASSLLAITNACAQITSGDIDVALAGGVDLSLDPFELVGFAKTEALTRGEMFVYDARSGGFMPGEGCGFLVLMRESQAVAEGRRIYARLLGWGISSDGQGGLTRPEIEGQLLALTRAYGRAGRTAGEVTYFEGHGTGTPVGDATEIRTLSRARREAAADPEAPARISSIKANLGHTKAAAGVAGVLKASLALYHQILPPTTGCEQPTPILEEEGSQLTVADRGELWPADRPLLAGVSAMGFGGINAHVVLEGCADERRRELHAHEKALIRTPQDAEVLFLRSGSAVGLQRAATKLKKRAAGLARSELADLCASVERDLGQGKFRAALVVTTPGELADGLELLISWLEEGLERRIDSARGIFLGSGHEQPKVLFLFPGHASPTRLSWPLWSRRFPEAAELFERAGLAPEGSEARATEIAQPAIVASSLAGLKVLDSLGLDAGCVVGHSLGELVSLHWAGALDESALLDLARARGRAVAGVEGPLGTMASIAADRTRVETLVAGTEAVIATENAPDQTVIAGPRAAVRQVLGRARAWGLESVELPVPYAFHSPLMQPAVATLGAHLEGVRFAAPERPLASTITGAVLSADADPAELLRKQLVSPARFRAALESAQVELGGLDLVVEVGPGHVLSSIVSPQVSVPCLALDACGPSLRPLLEIAGAAFALGAALRTDALFEGRFTRPFELDREPIFFANPCESAPPSNESDESALQGRAAADSELKQVELLPAPPPQAAARDQNALELVRELVAARIELPLEAVLPESRFLEDLHMNSIAVAQIAAEAARSLGRAPSVEPTEFARARVAELARALDERALSGAALNEGPGGLQVPGVDGWTRVFRSRLHERALPATQAAGLATGSSWRVFAPADHPLRAALEAALPRPEAGADVRDVLIALPAGHTEPQVDSLLAAARELLESEEPRRFVVVQSGGGGAAFARSLHLEFDGLPTVVVDLPFEHPRAVEWVETEIAAVREFSEAHYDNQGTRRVPLIELVEEAEQEHAPERAAERALGADDLLLVSGGAKGIGYECALGLAEDSGCALTLLGRSQPAGDEELAANLEHLRERGVRHLYLSADVNDPEAVLQAVRSAERHFGQSVSAVIHAAGINTPRALADLDEESFRATLAPKIDGTQNLLQALDLAALRFFCAFGSLIGRAGMRGEADYAVANEWLVRSLEPWRVRYPEVHFSCLEWSVWSGAGMGARLGLIDKLVREGITPIPREEGVRILRRLIARPTADLSLLVTGRFGEASTLEFASEELPFRRFLEKPRLFYPGVELVVDAAIGPGSDLYLDDHVFRGDRLLPAVMGLEAMAQAAMALLPSQGPPSFEALELTRPITVGRDARQVRIAALVRSKERVDVVVRGEESGFQVDHFSATCRFGSALPDQAGAAEGLYANGQGQDHGQDAEATAGFDPARELYGSLLFHGGRFRRLRGYRKLRARECVAEIEPYSGHDWFAPHLPATLELGDPGARDAVIHAIQACIPHATVLPTGVERVQIGAFCSTGPRFVRALERSSDGESFVYDVLVEDETGRLCEVWQGLGLRVVDGVPTQETWSEPLLVPYLERRIGELLWSPDLRVVLERNGGLERRARSDALLARALENGSSVERRPDGRPFTENGTGVSVAHAGDLTLVVAGPGTWGCDLEPVVSRSSATWKDLLGAERYALSALIADEADEDRDQTATRVWAAGECLKKAGASAGAPLVKVAETADRWVILASGSHRIATWIGRLHESQEPMAWAALVGDTHACV